MDEPHELLVGCCHLMAAFHIVKDSVASEGSARLRCAQQDEIKDVAQSLQIALAVRALRGGERAAVEIGEMKGSGYYEMRLDISTQFHGASHPKSS